MQKILNGCLANHAVKLGRHVTISLRSHAEQVSDETESDITMMIT